MAPVAGFDQGAGLGGIEAVTGHNLVDTGDKLDVTNTGHEARQHLIPGIERARGSITKIIDGDAPPTWRFGQKTSASFEYGGLWILECMITSVTRASVVNGVVTISADVEQDGELD